MRLWNLYTFRLWELLSKGLRKGLEIHYKGCDCGLIIIQLVLAGLEI